MATIGGLKKFDQLADELVKASAHIAFGLDGTGGYDCKLLADHIYQISNEIRVLRKQLEIEAQSLR